MNFLKTLLFVIPFWGFSIILVAQRYLPLNNETLIQYSSLLYSDTSQLHTSIKPYLINELKGINVYDSLFYKSSDKNAIEYLLLYDLGIRKDRTKLAAKLDGLTGHEIVDKIKWRKIQK